MKRLLQRLASAHPALRFAQVGAIGFVVDSLVLLFLYEAVAIDLLLARATAFVCAASSNWLLNRVFTFGDSIDSRRKRDEWGRFVTSALVAAIPNLGIFFLLTRLLPDTLGYVYFAMVCGILAGYACNYQLASRWVYRGNPRNSSRCD